MKYGEYIIGYGVFTIGRGEYATCNVEYLIALFQMRDLHGIGLPNTVQTCRHEVIHDVVFGSHRVKHTPDMLGFFLLFYGFISEMG